MKRIPVLLFLLALTCGSAQALTPRELDGVPMLALRHADVATAMAKVPANIPHGPLHFAASVASPGGLDDGTWTVAGDDATWRLRLFSAGAAVMTAFLDDLDLPTGAELRFMSADGRVVRGPYTRRDLRKHHALWTALVPGEEALLELRVRTAAKDAVRLHLASVGHGIVDPFKDLHDEPPGGSGSCNFDAVCTQGDGWRDQIRSTGLIQIGGSTFCTGQLVNNTSQSGIPYFLTADHCGITSGIFGTDATVVVYWKYQRSSCNAGTYPSVDSLPTQNGATLRAHDVTADFSLIELDSPPPIAANVFYAGFNASAVVTPASGATIHHPTADVKKISLFTLDPTRASANVGGHNVTAFKVFWNQGVTEPGSSGSALFNQNREIVGVLSGGTSGCGPDVNEPDYFGRLDAGWNVGLKTYLDPGNTGALNQCGTNPGGNCTTTPTDPGGGDGDDGGGGGGGAFGAAWVFVLLGLLHRLRLRARPAIR